MWTSQVREFYVNVLEMKAVYGNLKCRPVQDHKKGFGTEK